MQINWQTVPNEASLRQCCATNISRHINGPRSAAKRVQTPLELFKLPVTNEMVDTIVRYRNDCIQPDLERFALVLENGKSPNFHLVDHIDIKSFFGILYLCSAFHLNMLNTRDLQFYESAHDILSLPYHGIDFILSASSLHLVISPHSTIDGKMTYMLT